MENTDTRHIHPCYNNTVQLQYDPLHSEDNKAVLEWFDEEQGVLMEVAENYIPHALKYSSGNLCLDPGCGSAVLSLIAVKKFEAQFRGKIQKVVAIDVNEQAIAYAKRNAKINGVSHLYEFQDRGYDLTSVPKHSAAIISHNVPYHPTKTTYAGCPHISCDGGEDGQKLLKAFLEYSSEHLAENGVLYGIVNCRGNEKPEFMNDIRTWYKNDSIYWHPIHHPCSTFGFLEYITRWTESKWAREIAEKYPLNHVGIYVIVRDGQKKEQVVHTDFTYKTKDWQFRWDAHRMIQDNAVKKQQEMCA